VLTVPSVPSTTSCLPTVRTLYLPREAEIDNGEAGGLDQRFQASFGASRSNAELRWRRPRSKDERKRSLEVKAAQSLVGLSTTPTPSQARPQRNDEALLPPRHWVR
jgi:hypothetical protein